MRKCTKEDPWKKEEGSKGGVEHPDAKEIGEDYGKGGGVADGDYITYKCPHCNHTWREELPN
jgi:hypothetical protein